MIDRVFPDADGVSHRFAEALAAGPMLLGIYKSSCSASKAIFPVLERIYQAYRDRGLTIWGVSQDSPNITRSFIRRSGITFPILIEGEGYPISATFDIRATPSIYVIAPDRTIRYATMGFLRDQMQEIGDAVAAVIGAEPVPIVTDADTELPLFVPG